MEPRHILALLAVLVAASLIGAHTTMEDWSEQASFSVDQVHQSHLHEDVPVLQYDDLPDDAQRAVSSTIEAPDHSHTIYGREAWPDPFRYDDVMAPGNGVYAIVYEDQLYRLYTSAGGGFGFLFYPIPFIVYGLLLTYVALQLAREKHVSGAASAAIAVGISFHVIGPVYDFPVLNSWHFFQYGIAATVAFGVTLLLGVFSSVDPKSADLNE